MTLAAVEVPWHQKRIDLAMFGRSGGVIAVELKVSKWRRAVDQAYVNRWAASSSWVGLWHGCITPETYRYASAAGVGVLAVTNSTVYPLLLPDPAPRPESAARLDGELLRAGSRVRDLLSFARRPRLALA